MFLSLSLAVGLATALAAAEAVPHTAAALIRQLDDPSFTVRQEADGKLRALGAAAVPLLRQELRSRPSLEVARRLESILLDQVCLRWHESLESGVAEARRTGKPILVVSTFGKVDDVYARGGQELQARTLGDLDVTIELSRHFVVVWQDLLPASWYGSGELIRPSLERQPADTRPYREGRGQGTVRSFFATSDGRLVHTLEGFWGPERFLREARLARNLIGRAAAAPEEDQLDIVRRGLEGVSEQPEYAVTGTPVDQIQHQLLREVNRRQFT